MKQNTWQGVPRAALVSAAMAVGLLALAGCAATTGGARGGGGGEGAFLQDGTLFGKDLGALAAMSPATVDGLRQQQCNPQNSANCQRLFNDYLAGNDHKALAIPVVEGGVGMALQRAGPQQAFLAAVYFCNHRGVDTPRLCDVQSVDGKDIRAWTSAAFAAHRQAQTRLTVPGQRFFGGEEAAGAAGTATDMRTGPSPSGATPRQIEGVATFSTQELAQALLSADPPLVIDVGSSYEVVPMARSLYNGGLAFDDAAADRTYEARFAGLLRQLSPDMSKTVVFYCRGRDCWFSVNAALRAKRLGYARVAWYRGGIHSWKAAGLPVATAVVKAVAHAP